MKSHGAMLSTSVESASFCLVLSDQVKMEIQYYKVSLKKNPFKHGFQANDDAVCQRLKKKNCQII